MRSIKASSRFSAKEIRSYQAREQEWKTIFEQMTASSSQLLNLAVNSETSRKQFSDRLQQEISKNDILENKFSDYTSNRKLFTIAYALLQEKMNSLFESITAISNSKCLEGVYDFQIDRLREVVESLTAEKDRQERAMLHAERELAKNRKELKRVLEARSSMIKTNTEHIAAAERTIAERDREIEELSTDLRRYVHLYEKTLKELGAVAQQNDRNKARIKKIKAR